jgi:dihydropyrimidine dehydrogenase (NAD+) subunit PreA
MVQAEAARRISTTPIPKLDANGIGRTHAVTPLERIPRVDEHHCVGCNLCSLVCPVDGCITMERVDNGLAPQTWAERSTAAPVRS